MIGLMEYPEETFWASTAGFALIRIFGPSLAMQVRSHGYPESRY
jgi:hypothetical protein